MKLIFPLFTALIFSLPLFSQIDHQWSFGIGSKGSDGASESVVDHLGNLYVIMEMQDSVDIDPGPGVHLIVPEYGMSEILTKYDPNGNLIYSYPFFVDYDDGYGVVVEARHNQLKINVYFNDSLVYLRNGVRQKLFEHPGFNMALLTTDLEGKILKSHFVNIPTHFNVNATYTFPDGHMLIGGTFKDTIIFHSLSPVKLINTGSTAGYMMLIDPNYVPVWYQQFEGTGNTDIETFAFGSDEKIYFAGKFRDTLRANTTIGPIELISSGGFDAYFGYMSMSGAIEKIFAVHGPGYDDIRDIQPDSDGSIFICGQYEKTVNFASAAQPPMYSTAIGGTNGYVGHYDENGNLIWLGLYPSTGYSGIQNIELKRGNELYLSGSFTKRGDLHPGPDSLIVTATVQSSPFISKLYTDGEFLWSMPLLGRDLAGVRSILILTEQSRIVLTGFYNDSIHVGSIPGEHTLGTEYGSDGFVVSYTEENVTTASHDATFTSSLEIMNLFPNPATDHITIRTESDLDNLSLYNATGALIYNVNAIQTNQVEIKLSGLPSGLYYVTTTSADQLLTGKFIKE